VENKYKGIFEVDTVTGLMFVPEGEGTKLDYETDKSFIIEVTVRDRCQENFCYPGKLAEKILWKYLSLLAVINF
jgi:hypothetical protein